MNHHLSADLARALFEEAGDALFLFDPDTDQVLETNPMAERLWVGFNDERGRYRDNHLGRGLRHEFDPLWVRVEVVRIVVD